MAKLADLLGKYLVEWPDGAEEAMQNRSKSSPEYMRVYFYDVCGDDFDFDLHELAEDAAHACVTKSSYLAARDRLHAETVKEMIQVGGTLEVQEFDADQALWDKVASESMSLFAATVQITKADVTYSFVAETACNAADAFMAERAKRMKGGL